MISFDNILCSEISKSVKDYYSCTRTLRQAANTYLLCPLCSWFEFMKTLYAVLKIDAFSAEYNFNPLAPERIFGPLAEYFCPSCCRCPGVNGINIR